MYVCSLGITPLAATVFGAAHTRARSIHVENRKSTSARQRSPPLLLCGVDAAYGPTSPRFSRHKVAFGGRTKGGLDPCAVVATTALENGVSICGHYVCVAERERGAGNSGGVLDGDLR
jgi:hypothetical protein